MASAPDLPNSVLREAFDAANEKHFLLARLFYRLLLGPAWRYCLLGFSYVKCVDDIVDVEPDPARALALLDEQTELIRRVYSDGSGAAGPAGLPHPTRFGHYLFTWDRDRGSELEPVLTDIMDTMSFDVRRKGRVLPKRDLRRHAVKVGATSIRFLAHFVDRGGELREAFLETSSLAYLGADNLIDLAHDLDDGIINVPAEDVEERRIALVADDPALAGWVDDEIHRVLRLFDRARIEIARLGGRKMRFLARVFLWRKHRAFQRFLERRRENR